MLQGQLSFVHYTNGTKHISVLFGGTMPHFWRVGSSLFYINNMLDISLTSCFWYLDYSGCRLLLFISHFSFSLSVTLWLQIRLKIFYEQKKNKPDFRTKLNHHWQWRCLAGHLIEKEACSTHPVISHCVD